MNKSDTEKSRVLAALTCLGVTRKANLTEGGPDQYWFEDKLVCSANVPPAEVLYIITYDTQIEDGACDWVLLPANDRTHLYQEIEVELLKQEAIEGANIKESMEVEDPRHLVTHCFEQLRVCATEVLYPPKFRTAMLRACCVAIACLQVTGDWISKMAMARAAKRVLEFKPPTENGSN